MATPVLASRHPGEPLAEGRNATLPHPAPRRDTRPAPGPNGPAPALPAPALGDLARGPRPRSTAAPVSEIDAALWFG